MTNFVDVHVHPPSSVLAEGGFHPYLPVDGLPDGPARFDDLADRYRALDGIALVHGFDAGSVLGAAALTNRRLAEAIAPHSGVLAGLGCVDPHRGEAAVVAAHDALRMGMRGLFFHPAAQQFDPVSRRAAPLWDMAQQLRLPVVVHCGVTSLGAGRPAGSGIALDVADPMRMDRVAATHPDLQIVLTGVLAPWEDEAVAVARHKANVHLAPAGVSSEEMGPVLRAAITGHLADRTMMGSGFPFHSPEEWLEGWASLEVSGEVDAAVRYGNAGRLFGL